ncbi:MAG: hypothetical protein ACI4C7_03980 [Clostridia bacterium]|nr:hypothetical protein [Clostridia bacterium]
MLNFCMSGCAKAVGLTALAFCMGIVSGMFLPIAVLVVIETLLLLLVGWLCLFKW